jgi:PAS domain S-box-containing protein
MAESRKTNAKLVDENRRLRAQIAQFEDRLDHLAEHGTVALAIKECDSLHRDVMSLVSDVVMIVNDKGRLVYVSPNAHLIFGYEPADILKQGRIAVVLPGELFDPDVLEQRREITNIACHIRDAVGRTRDLLVTVRRCDAHGGAVMYALRDVTDRIRIELDNEILRYSMDRRVEEQTRELRDSRERFRRMVEGLRDEYFFYASDPDGNITYVSPSVHTILGYDPKDIMGQNWRRFADTEHEYFERLEHYEQLRFAGVPTPAFYAPVRHADGSKRMLEYRDAPVRDADGRVIANEGIAKDVTERLQKDDELQKAKTELEERVEQRTSELTAINAALRETNQRYQSVVEDQLEFIVRWRPDGTRVFVNESYCRHSGTPREELIGGNFFEPIAEDDREDLERALSAVSIINPVITFEHRAVAPNGQVRWEHWTHRALFDAENKLVEYQSVGSDVTDRHRRDRQAQELTGSLDQLAALTDRENDVMHLVVAGDANKVIARKLNLSVKTIEKHRSSLMRKLHVRSVPELVRLAMLAEESAER